MKRLFIDTSTEKSFLALCENTQVKAWQPLPGGEGLSEILADRAKKFLQGVRPDQCWVGTGPGSYTGLRVGAAFAKGLALGWGVPLLGFESLWTFVPPTKGLFAVFVYARRGQFHVLKGEHRGADTLLEPSCLLEEKDLASLSSRALFSPHPERIPNLSCNLVECRPEWLLAKVLQEPLPSQPIQLFYGTSPKNIE